MILVNTDYISGKELEMLGLVKGSTIQSKHIGKDISQSFKTLVGGELKSYNEMMNDARALATKRMCQEAEALGADAVIMARPYVTALYGGQAEGIKVLTDKIKAEMEDTMAMCGVHSLEEITREMLF